MMLVVPDQIVDALPREFILLLQQQVQMKASQKANQSCELTIVQITAKEVLQGINSKEAEPVSELLKHFEDLRGDFVPRECFVLLLKECEEAYAFREVVKDFIQLSGKEAEGEEGATAIIKNRIEAMKNRLQSYNQQTFTQFTKEKEKLNLILDSLAAFSDDYSLQSAQYISNGLQDTSGQTWQPLRKIFDALKARQGDLNALSQTIDQHISERRQQQESICALKEQLEGIHSSYLKQLKALSDLLPRQEDSFEQVKEERENKHIFRTLHAFLSDSQVILRNALFYREVIASATAFLARINAPFEEQPSWIIYSQQDVRDQLQRIHEKYSEVFREAQQLRADNQRLGQARRQLEEENKRLHEEVGDKTANNQKLRQDLVDLNHQLEQSAFQKHQLEKEKGQLEEEKGYLAEEKEAAVRKLQSLRSQMTGNPITLQQIKLKIASLTGLNEQLLRQKEEAKRDFDKKCSLLTESLKRAEQLHLFEKERAESLESKLLGVVGVVGQVEQLQQELAVAVEKIEKLSYQLEEKESLLKASEPQNPDAAELEQQIESARRGMKELNFKAKLQEEELASLKEALERAEKEKAEQEEELASLKEGSRKVSQALAKSEPSFHRAQKVLQRLSPILRRHRQKGSSEVEQARQDLPEHSFQQERVSELEAANASSAQRIRDLEQKVKNLQQAISESSFRQQQAAMELELKQSKLLDKGLENEQLSWKNSTLLEEKSELVQRIQKAAAENQALRARLGQGRDYNIYFPNDILFKQPNHKEFLISTVEKVEQATVQWTRLLFRWDQLNKANFHLYVDGVPNVLLLLKLENGRVLGCYSNCAFTPGCKGGDNGVLMVASTGSVFYLRSEGKAIAYDDYYLIFGNSEVRLKSGEALVFSNFGIANSYYEHNHLTVDALFGEGKDGKELPISSYEIYQLLFDL